MVDRPAKQLDGADPASCGKTNLSYYLSAGRAAHLEAVRRAVDLFQRRRFMPSKEIRRALSTAGEHYSAHPEDAKSEDKPARATLVSGLRISVEGPGFLSPATDMPTALGGEGSAPSPGWLRRAAQAACEATVIAIRAAQAGVAPHRLGAT